MNYGKITKTWNFIIIESSPYAKDAHPNTIIEIVNRRPGYNQTTVDLRLLKGEWPPEDEDFGLFLNSIPQCGGHRVQGNRENDTLSVKLWGCD